MCGVYYKLCVYVAFTTGYVYMCGVYYRLHVLPVCSVQFSRNVLVLA